MYEVSGQPVVIGYPFSMRLQTTTDMFPSGSTFTAHVRDLDTDLLLATLTTANGKLTRIDSRNLDVSLSASDSTAWVTERVVFDIVRTDVNPKEYLGIKIQLYVENPVTRGL